MKINTTRKKKMKKLINATTVERIDSPVVIGGCLC